MSEKYDNWERLVEAVLDREELREIAACHSRNPSTISNSSSESSRSSFRSSSRLDDFINYEEEGSQLSNAEDFIWKSVSKSQMSVLDRRTGKVCYVVGAKELNITWGNTPEYWKWKSDSNSRFPKVAVLQRVWWLDIKAKIETQMLSPNTTYVAYLVYKFDEDSWGLGTSHVYVRFTDDESKQDAEKRAEAVDLQLAGERPDGWKEVAIGNFCNDRAENGEVEARLMEIRSLHMKSGLIVEAIEFRPTNNESLVLPNYLIRSRKGKGFFSNLRISR